LFSYCCSLPWVALSSVAKIVYDLSNDTTMAQKIVASLILPIMKIIVIEDHKFDNTFLHVVFRSQSLLEKISDQIGSDIN
jgi:hypothetical protein